MKKIILALVLMSTSTFAAEVCVVSPYFYDGSKTVVSCSDVDQGVPLNLNKTLTVVLKEKIEAGFQIQGTTPITTSAGKDVTGSVIYTLVKP